MSVVVIAGGGTAGHTSPMIATAEALRRIDPAVEILCVGTPRGLEQAVIPAAGLELALIDPVPFPRRLGYDLAALPWRLARAVAQARRVLRQRRADVVLGVGGYAALPVYLAAWREGIPVVLHEANAVPGLANRVAARFARHVVVTFSATGLPRQAVLGMPLRSAIVELDRAAARPSAQRALGLADAGPGVRAQVLVSGGSQGAASINQAVAAALPQLLAAGLTVIHITGPKNFAAAAPAITDATTGAQYLPLAYVDDMAQAYAAADLLVGRAGAATICEVATLGLPAIVVPLPHGNGEQAKNAADLVAAGGAILLPDAELTAARLVTVLTDLVGRPDELQRMAAAGPALMPRDVGERLARLVLVAASVEDRPDLTQPEVSDAA